MISAPDLVALLYRADRTQLCLPADVTVRRDRQVSRQQVLLAPGGQYRIEDAGHTAAAAS